MTSINTTSKGNVLQRGIRDALTPQGYEIEITHRQAIRTSHGWSSLGNDFFGCIDLIAMKEDDLIFIQSTVYGHQSEKFEELLEHKWPNFTKVEIWAWHGGRKSKDMKFDGNGKCKVVKAQGWDIWRLDHAKKEFVKAEWIDAV